jgi:hypothetical protein
MIKAFKVALSMVLEGLQWMWLELIEQVAPTQIYRKSYIITWGLYCFMDLLPRMSKIGGGVIFFRLETFIIS